IGPPNCRPAWWRDCLSKISAWRMLLFPPPFGPMKTVISLGDIVASSSDLKFSTLNSFSTLVATSSDPCCLPLFICRQRASCPSAPDPTGFCGRRRIISHFPCPRNRDQPCQVSSLRNRFAPDEPCDLSFA